MPMDPRPTRALIETPSQTAGPYVHIGLIPHQAGFDIFEHNFSNILPAAAAERIRIEGRVFDGAAEPVRDVLVEIWQADPAGRYDDPAFRGWGRTGSDFQTGLWWFETVKPGRVPGGFQGKRLQAPHINLWLVARGINLGLATRLYFADEAAANAEDPVLGLIEQASRRQSLIARREQRDDGPAYVLDIHLQGDAETVFFEF